MAHFPHFETTTEANRTSRVTFRGREGVFLACSLASAEVERGADVESRRVYDYNLRATARRVKSNTPPRALHSSTATPLAILHPKSVPSHTSHAAPEGGARRKVSVSSARRDADNGEETRDAARPRRTSIREPIQARLQSRVHDVDHQWVQTDGRRDKCAIPGCFAAASAASVGDVLLPVSSRGEEKRAHRDRRRALFDALAEGVLDVGLGNFHVRELHDRTAGLVLVHPDKFLEQVVRSLPPGPVGSTMTTPITSSAAEARVHDDGPLVRARGTETGETLRVDERRGMAPGRRHPRARMVT